MKNTTKNTEVLIVGAGPSGLMMACQLALRHISFRIIDSKEHGSHCSGALIIQARTLEILDQMGIAKNAIQKGIIAHKINIIFNGKKPLSLALENMGKGLTKFPILLMLEQSKTEQLLIDFICAYGHSIERNTTLLRFSKDRDSVTSILKLPNGTEEIVKTSFLIAADGSQSLVRRQLNIPFLGKTHALSLFVLDGKADIHSPSNDICFSFSKNASTGIFPLTEGRWRIDGTIPKKIERKDILTFSDIEKNFARRTLMDIKLQKPQWFSVFHSHQRYAESFRNNRCFLVGDAAHILSPVGAQGMNTGLQDAYNLAWKLSLVIDGKANDSLLDSYHTERQPIARKLVRSTDWAFQLVTSENFVAKKFRLHIAPLLLRLAFPMIEKQKHIGQFLFQGISELGIHYQKNAFSNHTSQDIFPRRAPKPGDRLPYILFHENTNEINIQDKLNNTGFHLFIFTKQTSISKYTMFSEKYKDLLSTEIFPFNAGTSALYKRLGVKSEGCYLIKPDMHIAYRSNKPGIEHVEEFLSRYLRLNSFPALSSTILMQSQK